MTLLYATLRFDVRRHVFTSRDFKEIKNKKTFFFSNRQGQRSTHGQGQIKVKCQGHITIVTILYVIVVIQLNL